MNEAETTLAVRQAGINALTEAKESEPQSVARMLHEAIQKGVPIETMERLVDLHERVSRRSAEQEFAAAMATFQMECRSIPKTSTGKITSERAGTKFEYTYAELDQIAETAGPLLHKNGFSFGWDSETTEKTVAVTCTLRHRNGHSISARFASPLESASPMGAQHKASAALTVARRQSLIQVLGLTTTDPDADAAAPAAHETINAESGANLEALISETKADRAKFLKWLGVETLAQIRASDYQRAIAALEQKRRAS